MQHVACRTGGTGPQGRESPIEQENRMRTNPTTPKLLPWLAKKAGISERRATTLWLESERWAARRATTGSSAYYKLAVDRLLELTAAESLREDAASFGWRPWARAQARLWAVSMQAAQQGSALAARGWRLIGSTAQQHQLN
jgi:hypothetical protein